MVIFPPFLFSVRHFQHNGGKAKNQDRADRQASDGGNFSVTVLLCVTAVLIANLLRDGESKRGMEEDRKNDLNQGNDIKRETMNPVVSPAV